MNHPVDLGADNTWSSIVYFGTPDDIGDNFDIIVVTVNSEAQDVFNGYLSEARDQVGLPGLEVLPEGAMIYDRITVIRE